MRHRSLISVTLVLVVATSCTADDSSPSEVDQTTTTAAVTTEVTGDTGPCGLPGDADYVCQVETSDDRVSGIAETYIVCEFTEDGDVTVGDCAGPSTVTNDGGTWEGTCEGTTTWSTTEPDHVHSIDCTYLGTGAYAGLRFREHLEGVDFPWTITGRIEPAQ